MTISHGTAFERFSSRLRQYRRMQGGDIGRGAGCADAGVSAQSRDPEAGLTRRQFLVGGGALEAVAVAALVAVAVAVLGAVCWRSWTVRGYWCCAGAGESRI